jgi:hypothetical protein
MSLGRSGDSIWRDIVPVVVFGLALLITFSMRQYSDVQPNLVPTHGSIGRPIDRLSERGQMHDQ